MWIYFIVFDLIGEGWQPLKENIFKAFKAPNIKNMVSAGKLGWKLIQTSDYITDLSNRKRAYAVDSYKVDSIMANYHIQVEKTFGESQMMDLMKSTIDELNKVEIDENRNPIKIGLIGEIYTLIEPFVNLEIERKLEHNFLLVLNLKI
jgi:predicted nucleotide-binding protein (sugar kinase/HSP70/actin superfamily)